MKPAGREQYGESAAAQTATTTIKPTPTSIHWLLITALISKPFHRAMILMKTRIRML